MDDKRCWNCIYFNGEYGDGEQFCDEKEIYVRENGCCFKYMKRKESKD